jgi:hypothetical protein
MKNTKYIPPPDGCDGLVPVHQRDIEVDTRDHLLYLRGIADVAGYVCISDELMQAICDGYQYLDRRLNRAWLQLDTEKSKTANLTKKLKEMKNANNGTS